MSQNTSTIESRIWLVIPAAGIGSRMRADRPKQYLEIANKTVLEHTLARFSGQIPLSGIVVALSPEDPYWDKLDIEGRYSVQRVDGGAERCNSVMNALDAISAQAHDHDWVMVHDAARPCVRLQDLQKLIREVTSSNSGGILATPVRDTMKRSSDGHIMETVERTNLWHALTPQMFPFRTLYDALSRALSDGFLVTDEASAIEHAGIFPLIIEGHSDNIKITHPEDLALAEFYLKQQGGTEQ